MVRFNLRVPLKLSSFVLGATTCFEPDWVLNDEIVYSAWMWVEEPMRIENLIVFFNGPLRSIEFCYYVICWKNRSLRDLLYWFLFFFINFNYNNNESCDITSGKTYFVLIKFHNCSFNILFDINPTSTPRWKMLETIPLVIYY